jgi:hypothetical protein
MATATVTRTSIELLAVQSAADHDVHARDSTWESSTLPADPDNVIEASRIADAAVPDGGYGWWIVAACSTLCFWFVGTTQVFSRDRIFGACGFPLTVSDTPGA